MTLTAQFTEAERAAFVRGYEAGRDAAADVCHERSILNAAVEQGTHGSDPILGWRVAPARAFEARSCADEIDRLTAPEPPA